MNKERFIRITMVILPVMAMMLACTPTSVTVFDVATQTVVLNSFFVLVEGIIMTACFPLAGLCCGLALAFSAACLIRRKVWMNKAIVGASFVATTLAVLPLLEQTEVILLPNMLFPILMGVEALLGYVQMKKKEPENQAPRLKR